MEEQDFLDWYHKLAKSRGFSSNPYDKEHYYDYKAFWKKYPKEAENVLNSKDSHFTDEFKLPGHPTFSDESIYSNSKTPGGHWTKDKNGNDVFNHSDYTQKYAKRTKEYLNGGTEKINDYKTNSKMAKITPEEINHIVDVLKKEHGSDYQLESKDFDSILKGIGDPETIKKVNEKLGRTETYDDTKQSLANIMASAKNYPNYQARLEKKMQRGELTESLASGLGVARDLFQIGVASGQIKQSNATLAKLQRPALPGLPRNDKTLDSAISNAQTGTFDAARTIEPARQAIDTGYQNDIMNARSGSGGQQGMYGALAQEASLNRNRSLMGLAPMIDNARAREQARVDDLLAQRSAQRQQGFENQTSLYNLANDNYNQNVQTASQLGQAGRENLYGGVGNLSDSLAVLGGNVQMPEWAKRQKQQEAGQTTAPEYTGVPEMQNMQSTLDQHAAYRNPAYIKALMAGQKGNTPIRGSAYYQR